MSPNVPWFSGRQFIGREVVFEDNSIWRLEKKIKESDYRLRVVEDDPPWEARAVYTCTKVKGRRKEKEAIMKVRMQIPNFNTEDAPDEERAKQALDEISFLADTEKTALEWLTADNCSCTPHLIHWKQEKQTKDLWVPNGYLIYTLMTKVPGQPLQMRDYELFTREKRDQIRAAFKKAWLECKRCHSLSNSDHGMRNLLWDDATGKMYIVDWEDCTRSEEWQDFTWCFWDLLRREGLPPDQKFIY